MEIMEVGKLPSFDGIGLEVVTIAQWGHVTSLYELQSVPARIERFRVVLFLITVNSNPDTYSGYRLWAGVRQRRARSCQKRVIFEISLLCVRLWCLVYILPLSDNFQLTNQPIITVSYYTHYIDYTCQPRSEHLHLWSTCKNSAAESRDIPTRLITFFNTPPFPSTGIYPSGRCFRHDPLAKVIRARFPEH